MCSIIPSLIFNATSLPESLSTQCTTSNTATLKIDRIFIFLIHILLSSLHFISVPVRPRVFVYCGDNYVHLLCPSVRTLKMYFSNRYEKLPVLMKTYPFPSWHSFMTPSPPLPPSAPHLSAPSLPVHHSLFLLP